MASAMVAWERLRRTPRRPGAKRLASAADSAAARVVRRSGRGGRSDAARATGSPFLRGLGASLLIASGYVAVVTAIRALLSSV
jgi:hypothetical protein